MPVTTTLGDHYCFYVRTGAAIRRFGPHATDGRITNESNGDFERGDTQ